MKYEVEDPPEWVIPVLIWAARISFALMLIALTVATLHKAGAL